MSKLISSRTPAGSDQVAVRTVPQPDGRLISYQAQPLDTSGADRASALAAAFGRFTKQTGEWAQQLATKRGQDQGEAVPGSVTAPTKKTNVFGLESPYDHAYNQAVMSGHEAAVDTDIASNVARIADDNRDSSAGFDSAMGGYTKGLLSGVDPALRAGAERAVTVRAIAARQGIVNGERQRAVETAAGQVTDNLLSLRNEELRARRDGNVALADTLHTQQDNVIAKNTKSDANPVGVLAPEFVAKLRNSQADESAFETLVGQGERMVRNQGPDAAEKWLADLHKKGTTALGVNPETLDRADSHISSLINDVRAEQRAHLGELQDSVRSRMADSVAMTQDGVAPTSSQSVTRGEVNAAFGQHADKVWGEYQKNSRTAADSNLLKNSTFAEQQALIASEAPAPGAGYAEQRQRQAYLASEADRINKARLDDPAAAVSNSSVVKKAAQGGTWPAIISARITEQQRLGVDTQNQKPLTKDETGNLIAAATDPAMDPVKFFANIDQTYGEYAPQVRAQLQAKLPPAYVALSTGNMPRDAATRLAGLANVPDKVQVDALPDPTQAKGVDAEIASNLSDLKASLAGRPGTENTVAQLAVAARKLTLDYMRQGSSLTDAARAAANNIAGAYNYEKRHDQTVRIPKTFDAGAVMDGTDVVLGNLTPSAVKPPTNNLLPDYTGPDRISRMPLALDSGAVMDGPLVTTRAKPDAVAADQAANYVDRIKHEGQWVTNSDESGVDLWLDGLPVNGPNGKQLSHTWNYLSTIAHAAAAESKKRKVSALRAVDKAIFGTDTGS